jgi:hypothetical protein
MAGGKETPRQKMIGMMYLVLTALLALNVSKQVLDAFVAIEENMQKAAINHLERGDGAKRSLSGELAVAEKDKEDPTKVKAKKIKYFLDVMNKIDAETGKFIELVDGIKKEILTKSGEDLSIGDKDAAKILWVDYNKKEPIRPARMNLAAVQAKDQYDVPMDELVGSEPMTPDAGKSGMKLWKAYNDYRSNLVKLVGTYTVNGKDWTINPTAINNYKDFNDLTKQVEAMIEKSNCNKKEDKGKLRDLYIELTKPEKVMAGGEGEEQKEWPWIGKTFDHAPLVAAIASLTSLQVEVLGARASAFEHIKSRVSTGEFSFNSIEGFAVGPTMVTQGDEAELKVMMAAFDTDNQPVISGGNFTVNNGQGIMKIPTSGIGDKTMSGTVKIRKKSGDWAEKPWKYTVKVIEPAGSISLPDMQILYKNYKNNVQAVASGYDKTDLVILEGSASKTSNGSNKWIITPNSGSKLTLAVKGTNSITNKSSVLNKVTYKVKPLPDPEVYFNGQADGGSVTKNSTSFMVKYNPEVTLTGVTFPISGWTLVALGRQITGTGKELNAQAINILKQSSGNMVTLQVTYQKPDKTVKKATGLFKIK